MVPGASRAGIDVATYQPIPQIPDAPHFVTTMLIDICVWAFPVLPTAPSACLQYYTGVSGTIKSFNFDGSETGPHLASQSYAICIRDEALYCSIEYAAS